MEDIKEANKENEITVANKKRGIENWLSARDSYWFFYLVI
jgi:hypothetical protein